MKEIYKSIARNAPRKDPEAVCTTNSARLRLGSRLGLEAISHLLQFGRGHPSHFYQFCNALEEQTLFN